jgi:hypothetical protein
MPWLAQWVWLRAIHTARSFSRNLCVRLHIYMHMHMHLYVEFFKLHWLHWQVPRCSTQQRLTMLTELVMGWGSCAILHHCAMLCAMLHIYVMRACLPIATLVLPKHYDDEIAVVSCRLRAGGVCTNENGVFCVLQLVRCLQVGAPIVNSVFLTIGISCFSPLTTPVNRY